MSCEEHYFENILYTYKRTGDWKKAIDDKLNTDELSIEVIDAIQTCAIYIIDVCNWNKDNVAKLLSHDLFD